MKPDVTADELVALLGHSIRSKPLRAAMKTLSVAAPKNNFDSEGNRYDMIAENRRRGVSLTFLGYRRYRVEYGDAKSVADKSKDEPVLMELEFSKMLPYGLARGDSAVRVVEKVGRKPFEKSSDVSYGQAWWFRFDEHKLLVALDRKARLLWARVFLVDAREKARKRLQATLRKQNADVRPESATAILAYRTKIPTAKWTRRMTEGDTSFTDPGIEAVNAVLRTFVEGVAEDVLAKSAAKIYGAVKRAVRSLNRVSSAHGPLIETLEREELCAFLHDVVRATGLDVPRGTDLTEEWRDW